MSKLTAPLIVYLPDTRGVEISPYGKGNLKIGPNVYTYSRVAGRDGGTCPGSTDECENICYAKRIQGPVLAQYKVNSAIADVPPIPVDCRLLRIHVSGDFDTPEYIDNWINRLWYRPDVTAWAYTRSWRVRALLSRLETLRSLSNMQLFASMDSSTTELPPASWRIAWIDGDVRAGKSYWLPSHSPAACELNYFQTEITRDGVKSLICPEETQAVKNCEECGFCWKGQRNDVTFLRH